MADNVQVAGVEEARAKLTSILRSAHQEGTVTIVTKRGVPYAVQMATALETSSLGVVTHDRDFSSLDALSERVVAYG